MDEHQAKRARLEDAVRRAHAHLAEARIALAGLYGQPGHLVTGADEEADHAAVQRAGQDADESLDRLRRHLEGYPVDEA